MSHTLKVKHTHLLCGIVFLLSLISGQSDTLFGISGGILYQILYFSKYIATILLFIYALSRKRQIPDFEIKRFLSIFLPLVILMLIIEFNAAFTSPMPTMYGIRYWTRSLFVFLDRICVYIAAVSAWILCADETVDCLVSTLLIDELLLFISAVFDVGFSGIMQSVFSAFTFRGFTSNYFEIHEQTYVIGLCIIYYLFFDKDVKNKIVRIILLAMCFILGAKRIGILGIVVAGLFAFFIHKKGLTRRKLIIIGIAGMGICFSFLFIIYNGEFFSLLSLYNINNMGRDLIYGYFTRRTDFSLSQKGWGMAGVAKAVENMDRAEVLYMSVIRGLHNDILKIYIDFGFFGSFFWFFFNLIYFPVKMLQKYGKKTATVYITLIMYLFIIYLTDNIESSYICQVALLLITLSAYWRDKTTYTKLS